MGVATDLAPLGGMLDSLLDRLAALEKVADGAAPPSAASSAVGAPPASNGAREASPAQPPTPSSSAAAASVAGDPAQIAALQSEIADLKSQLEASEKQRQRLERQLAAAGIKLAEDIPYAVAKAKVHSIAERMQEIGSANVEIEGDEEQQKALREEYFTLELEMDKYNSALTTSDEYIAEGRAKEDQWEKDTSEGNRAALRAVRRHMPVEVRNYSEARLTDEATPNGKSLPKVIAKKFKRCNVLQLLRMDPTSIARSHPASLENYRVNGMTLTERRAVYCHLTESAIDGGKVTIAQSWAKNRKDPMVDRKFVWYTMMRDNLKSALTSYDMHVQQSGGPEDHSCDLIGNQCPVRSDRNAIDYYAEDYGFPEGDVYQTREQAATISLSAAPENMADPSELSEKRARDEIENRKRLAYEEWKATYEKEHREYTEERAVQEVKLEGLEQEIEQCQADEEGYAEEHQALKGELSALPRGSKERLPLMKKVNVAQTQAKEAKRRSVAAREELESLRKDLENGQTFRCSVPKPEWAKEGDDADSMGGAASLSSSGHSAGFGQHTLRSAQSSRSSSSVGSNKPRGGPGGGGAGRGGLLAAIQGRGNGGSSRRSMSGGLLAGIQSRGKLGSDNSASSDEAGVEAPDEKGANVEEESATANDASALNGNGKLDSLEHLPSETTGHGSKETTLEKPNQYNGVGDAASLFSSKEFKAKEATTRQSASSYSGLGAAASLAPARDYESYRRKKSSGQGVNRTTLLACPPPSQEEVNQRSERIKKQKEELEAKMQKEQEEAQAAKAAREKARADAAERAERLKKEKEEREQEEARQREEAEQKERERQEAKAKAREEEAEKRRLAKEKEAREREEARQREKEEKEREQQGKIAELEEKVKECQEEVDKQTEAHARSKAELKELPRGSKDRVSKMKEMNVLLTQCKDAKKAAADAQEELDLCLKSK
ncbi:hypothetical protein ACHAXT_004681 [Thalassiosira profunda]